MAFSSLRSILRLELHDARRLFEDGAPVLGLGVHDLLHLALPDDGVALLADAHAVQERDDVLEAAGLHVQKILALARTVETAGHGDLVIFDIEHAVRVVKDERHLAERELAARLRAAEDDVLHGGAAQRLCRLLAQHPAHGVRNVALAAAVGPDDTRHAVVKFDGGLVRKGFEADQLYLFEIHCSVSIPKSDLAAACSASFLVAPRPCALLPSARTSQKNPSSSSRESYTGVACVRCCTYSCNAVL